MQAGAASEAESVDILYVEDDAALRETSCELLREEGFRVAEVGDGAAALAYLGQGHRPALVILDLQMPVMGGYEFIAHLRSDPRFADMPVLVVSAVAQSGVLAGPDGVVAYLSKPFEIEALIGYVRRFARRRATA
jgi:chemosensory pili system protein ChpA (sensor histidine kinase/response regulator)